MLLIALKFPNISHNMRALRAVHIHPPPPCLMFGCPGFRRFDYLCRRRRRLWLVICCLCVAICRVTFSKDTILHLNEIEATIECMCIVQNVC